jgi:hypothetical protein
MSSIVISGDTSGAITLAAPSIAGTNTATLPAATGTVMVSGNMPAFSYYATSDQAFSNATSTKVTYPTSLYDTTGGMYNSSTSRFTPTVAGYYQVNAFFEYYSTGSTAVRSINIYKNGGNYRRSQQQTAATNANTLAFVSAIIYMNGSTDYLEIYAYQSTGGSLSNASSNGQTYNGFEACLIRTA